MGALRVMSRRGDDVAVWDAQRVELGDPEALAAVREAERIFAEQRSRGATAMKITPGQPPVRIDQFNPSAEQIVMSRGRRGLAEFRHLTGMKGQKTAYYPRRRSRRRTPAIDIGESGRPIGSMKSEHGPAWVGSEPSRISTL